MTQVRDWHFPVPCPNCLRREGVPTGILEKTATSVELFVRCCRCANEWRLHGELPPLVLKPKLDRRQRPRDPL